MCVCVFVCACAHVCVFVCVHVHMCVCMCVSLYWHNTCGTAKQMLSFFFKIDISLDIQVHMQAYACEYVCAVCVGVLAQNV